MFMFHKVQGIEQKTKHLQIPVRLTTERREETKRRREETKKAKNVKVSRRIRRRRLLVLSLVSFNVCPFSKKHKKITSSVTAERSRAEGHQRKIIYTNV